MGWLGWIAGWRLAVLGRVGFGGVNALLGVVMGYWGVSVWEWLRVVGLSWLGCWSGWGCYVFFFCC